LSKVDVSELEILKDSFSRQIPDSSTIAREVFKKALDGEVPSNWIKEHFSELVEQLQVKAYERYLQYEREAWRPAFAEAFAPKIRKCKNPEGVTNFIGNQFNTLDKFFLSRTQSRRSRAGMAFEVFLHDLFKRLRYPFTPQPGIDGNPDFVFPSIDHYRNDPQDSIVFTAKRTLRERWRQIVTEGARGLGFFLA